MVLPLLAGLVLVGVTGWFTVQAVATIVFWGSIGAGGLVAAGLFWHFHNERYLSEVFDFEIVEYMSIGVVSAFAGFISFRLIQAVFAAVGWGAALVIAGLGVASVVLTPGVVFGAVADFVVFVSDRVGGD